MSKKLKGNAFVFGQPADAEECSFQNFADWLVDNSLKNKLWPFGSNSAETTAIIKKIGNFVIGLLCPGKSNKYYHSKEVVGGKLELKPNNMGDDATEMNFFCIRLDNFKGIYSYYAGSQGLSVFLDGLWKSYASFVTEAKERKVTELSSDNSLTQKKQKEILKNYSLITKKQYSLLMADDEYESFIKHFHRLEEVRITTNNVISNDETAIKGIMKQCVHKYTFWATPINSKIFKWLLKIYQNSIYKDKNDKIKHNNGRVTGYDDQNQKLFFDFNKNTKDYLDYDYDEIGVVDTENLENHAIIRKMIENLEQNVIFRD